MPHARSRSLSEADNRKYMEKEHQIHKCHSVGHIDSPVNDSSEPALAAVTDPRPYWNPPSAELGDIGPLHGSMVVGVAMLPTASRSQVYVSGGTSPEY